MAGRRKTLGLLLGAVGGGILLASVIPIQVLVVIEGAILIAIGWLFLTKG